MCGKNDLIISMKTYLIVLIDFQINNRFISLIESIKTTLSVILSHFTFSSSSSSRSKKSAIELHFSLSPTLSFHIHVLSSFSPTFYVYKCKQIETELSPAKYRRCKSGALLLEIDRNLSEVLEKGYSRSDRKQQKDVVRLVLAIIRVSL